MTNLREEEISAVYGGIWGAIAIGAIGTFIGGSSLYWLTAKGYFNSVLWHINKINMMKCMGEGRNVSISCHGGEGDRGWRVHDNNNTFFCATWFCCSGFKGNYEFLHLKGYSYNCATGEPKLIS